MKKQYSIIIDGVEQGIRNVITLDEAIKALDATLAKDRDALLKSTETRVKNTKALTDEEKALKRLEETYKKIENADSDLNKEQAKATQELRERNRETARQIAQSQLAEGSIRAMGMELTDLRNAYEALSAEERNNEAIGGKLITQIQALDSEYKALRESTGNFRDSVGNYKKAFEGLDELTTRFELASRGGLEFASSISGTNDVLDIYGATASTVAKTTEGLAGVTILASTASEVYNSVVKEGIVQQKIASVIDGIRTLQLRAKALAEASATRATVGATVAQVAFNFVANLNPYLLLATGVGAFLGVIGYFISRTDEATAKLQEFADLQSAENDRLERRAELIRGEADEQVRGAERTLAVLQARGAKTEQIRKAEDVLADTRRKYNAQLRGFYASEVQALDENRRKLLQYANVLDALNRAKAKGDDKLQIDVDLNGKIDKVNVEEAITAVQAIVNNLDKKVSLAVELNTDKQALEAEAQVRRAQRAKENEERRTEEREKAKQKAKDRAQIELSAQRQLEDARAKLIEGQFEQAEQGIRLSYARQIEDMRAQLRENENLTVSSRKSIDATIKELEKVRGKELGSITKERVKRSLEIAKELETSKTALEKGELARRDLEIKASYGVQISAIQDRLTNEKDLTVQDKKNLNGVILNLEKQKQNDLQKLQAESLDKRFSAELTASENQLNKILNKTGAILARDKDGLKLINVGQTKKNAEEANKALKNYVDSVKLYQLELETSQANTLVTLKAGTPEYAEALNKYAQAHEDAEQRIRNSNAQIEENTKASAGAITEYLKGLFGKVGEYANALNEAVSAVLPLFIDSITSQKEALQTELDAISSKYEDAKKLREDTVRSIEDLEARIQQASGGTALALRAQLADSIQARNGANREEQRLASEKEKREAEIARKEKQIKRLQLVGSITSGIANTAEGVTRALGAYPPPVNLILAGVVGGAGAVQVGIMANQLAKLETGGRIKGKSHANGGVQIGLGYEAEAGEFMVNKTSFAKNERLIEYINAIDRPITQSETNAFARPSASSAPVIVNVPTQNNRDIIDAIERIDFKPVVSVKDIADVSDTLADVRDFAGA